MYERMLSTTQRQSSLRSQLSARVRAGALLRLARIHKRRQAWDLSLDMYRKACEASFFAFGKDAPRTGKALHDCGLVEEHLGNLDAARACYTRAALIFYNVH